MTERFAAALALVLACLAASGPAHAACGGTNAGEQPQLPCDPALKPPEVAPIVPPGTPPVVPPAIAPTVPPLVAPLVAPHGTTACGPGQVQAGADTVTRPVCK